IGRYSITSSAIPDASFRRLGSLGWNTSGLSFGLSFLILIRLPIIDAIISPELSVMILPGFVKTIFRGTKLGVQMLKYLTYRVFYSFRPCKKWRIYCNF